MFRLNPTCPVAQNMQPSAQPTCVETQIVDLGCPLIFDGGYCIRTVSTGVPSTRLRSNFVVSPSSLTIRLTSLAEPIVYPSATSVSRNVVGSCRSSDMSFGNLLYMG